MAFEPEVRAKKVLTKSVQTLREEIKLACESLFLISKDEAQCSHFHLVGPSS